MHCASCALLIEKALKKTPGVVSANVNFAAEKASVLVDGKSRRKLLLKLSATQGTKRCSSILRIHRPKSRKEMMRLKDPGNHLFGRWY
ncbi:MAG: heavy metal-associated domain-containing protein [Patescibacteria group bacterium]